MALVRPVVVFVGRALVGLVLAAVVYGALRVPYQNGVALCSGTLLGLFEPGVGLAVVEGGAVVSGTPGRVAVSVERTSLDLILVGAVLLVALLVGTPRAWRQPRALGSLPALLGLQIGVLLLASLGAYRELSGAASLGSAALGLVGAYGGLLLPLPLWLWAGGAAWLLPDAPPAPEGAPPGRLARNAPCPCGCGRKAKHCRGVPAEAR